MIASFPTTMNDDFSPPTPASLFYAARCKAWGGIVVVMNTSEFSS